MRISLIIAVLCFCFSGLALADNPPTTPAVQGNQGYVYGTAPKDAPASAETSEAHPITDIVNAVNQMDAWIQKNLW